MVTLYLLPSLNLKLMPKLNKELKPGTRIVSHAFDMGEAKPIETLNVNGRTVYFWTTPIGVVREGARVRKCPPRPWHTRRTVAPRLPRTLSSPWPPYRLVRLRLDLNLRGPHAQAFVITLREGLAGLSHRRHQPRLFAEDRTPSSCRPSIGGLASPSWSAPRLQCCSSARTIRRCGRASSR